MWKEQIPKHKQKFNIVSTVLKQVFILNDATLSSALWYANIRTERLSKNKKKTYLVLF